MASLVGGHGVKKGNASLFIATAKSVMGKTIPPAKLSAGVGK